MSAGLRTVSMDTHVISPRRMKIYFQDDAVRLRSQAIVQQLIMAVQETPATTGVSNRALAKKALKYRKVYDRLIDVDISSPAFDASQLLGVDWCHTPSLKAYCARLPVAI